MVHLIRYRLHGNRMQSGVVPQPFVVVGVSHVQRVDKYHLHFLAFWVLLHEGALDSAEVIWVTEINIERVVIDVLPQLLHAPA